MQRLVLKRGREKSLRRRHPWIFSGAVAAVEGAPQAGDTVAVSAADGAFLAWAAYSPQSQIRARAWSFDEAASIDAGFIERTLARAVAWRASLPGLQGDALRLVHGESDGLPGLVVDRYGDTAVMQVTSAGAERFREVIADTLAALPGMVRVYERSDAEVRALEGLAPRVGALRGDAPPALLRIEENGLRFGVAVGEGQKTGFFLDQRDNRALLTTLAEGREVLDAFCYTGGFGVAALAGGATRLSLLESSAPALARARDNVAANDFDAAAVEYLEQDAFAGLRTLARAGRRFGLVVLDPPKFAPTEKHVKRAARAYKDINLWALRLLEPGGLLLTFSCSGAVGDGLFQSIVAGAAVDAGCDARIVRRLGAAPDHPVALTFPEGHYLKGLLLARV